MKTKATIPATLIPLNAIALGRFVTNTKSPAEEFYDSNVLANNGDKVIITPRHNFREVLRCTLGTSTYSNLTAIIASHLSKNTVDYVHLESLSNQTYQLENSTDVFENICADPNARKWLLKMIGRRRSIYMVVGLETILNAEVSCGNLRAKEKGGEITVPVSAALAGALAIPIAIPDVLDVGIGVNKKEDHEVQASFLAPGEMVFAVQYRKLEFSWLSSKDIDKTTLRNSRWVINLGVRSLEKLEENNVLDAHFASESGDAEGEQPESALHCVDVEPLGIQLVD
ncbi:hypothetical protein ABW20_dc0103146 [Dactylellina cionopaga]|nr:hypothetical protein ABW20_dc0103146 [Dactylellina cionopaga]